MECVAKDDAKLYQQIFLEKSLLNKHKVQKDRGIGECLKVRKIE